MKTLLSIICVLFIGWVTYVNIQFGLHCDDYLELAANANSIEIAQTRLNKAIDYVEAHNLTKGNTSIIWDSPTNDIGMWYENLKASQAELATVKPDASSLEKSNILMKLRESLTANGEKGDRLVRPSGIAFYPNQTFICFLFWLSLLVLAGCITFAAVEI